MGYGSWRAVASASAPNGFVVHVPSPGTYHVLAQRNTLGCSSLEKVRIHDDAPAAACDLRLVALQGLEGSVARPDGSPVAGALVVVSPTPIPGTENGGPTAAFRYGDSLRTYTRGDGSFLLAGVHPEPSYTLRCVPDLAKPHLDAHRAEVRVGGPLRVVVSERECTGRSLDLAVRTLAGGAAVPDFVVSLLGRGSDGAPFVEERRTCHDPAGRLRWPDLPCDRALEFVVRAPGHDGKKLVIPPLGLARYEQVVELGSSASLVLRVLDHTEMPVAGLRYRVTQPVGLPDLVARGGTADKTDANGQAEVHGLDSGEHFVVAYPHDAREPLASARVQVPAGERTEVTLRVPR